MNVLFIMPDALRASNMSCCGYHRNTTPFIDKLASEGMLCKNVVAQGSHTLPGVVSAFSGVSVAKHKMQSFKNLAAYKRIDFWKNFHQPFTILKEKGYKIGGKHADFWNVLDFQIETKGGLEKVVEEQKENKFFLWYMPYHTHLPYNPSEKYEKMFLPEGYEVPESAKERFELAKKWMVLHSPGKKSCARTGEKIISCEEDPGWTFEVDPELPGKMEVANVRWAPEDRVYMMARYDGALRDLDDTVKGYYELLEKLGILDDTMIVISPDHAEEILERGSLGHASCSLGGTVYDEDIMVPLIIWHPKSVPANVVIDRQVSQIDIMPTLLDIMGIDAPEGTDGHSLMPLAKGEKFDFPEEAYSETLPHGAGTRPKDERRIHCIRTPDWKLIYNSDPNGVNYYELYNLKTDPEERIDIHAQNPDVAEPLKKRLVELMK